GGFITKLLQSLKEAKFPIIYPVNSKYTEVLGLPCYPDLLSIPGVIDHVLVAVPAEAAIALLDDCVAKGVKSVHFFTAGFSESGYAERAELEKTILDKAVAGGFRIIGPNCVGLFVPKSRLVSGIGMPLEPGPIGFISQSGGHALDLPLYSGPRGLRFSKVVSYGNASDVDESELLEYFTQDPETKIIAVYMEGVKDGRRFLKVLKEASARKPVVIYKGGMTEAGKKAARGHTGSLTSSVAVFNALCKQVKSIQVDDIEELIDVLVALRFTRSLPQGTGIAVIGAGGGPSVLASDEMEKAGLQVPSLSAELQAELKQFLPLAGSIFVNPVDAPNLTSPEAISATVRGVSKSPDIHMLVYHLGFHPISRWGDGTLSSASFLQPTINSLKEAQQVTGKPIILALYPALDLNGIKDFLAAQKAFVEAGFPVFHSLRNVAKAMARIVSWNRVWHQ
ncbi:MAG: CoA-binding protein, partial [Dehalococcoidales bacterium]|nr:CoA-binding protein [Dehalococcoidales bacterium]